MSGHGTDTDDNSHAGHDGDAHGDSHGGHGGHGSHDDHDGHDDHGGHDDDHDAHASHAAEASPAPQGAVEEKWWRLPFDVTTNFSLFGYLWGGFGWKDNEKKRVDMSLDE